ncbi:dsDNA nuclease domain-containing protein [Pseudomonas fildesensis]|uniref:dsDNA nuclease domain-containing protein n=1 Tax=Pseudomonas fildesensis TaxID=1674920 RepID=UPI00387B4EE3
MTKKSKAANSGIDALLGFEFQRNCALYLLLDDYAHISSQEFFLCIEHHDDFLFCYRSDCRSNIEAIHSYQAKKLSGSTWTIDARFAEIIAKMLGVGNDLKNDSAPKCKSYTHKLTFISNTDIKLSFSPKKEEKKNGKEEITHLLNEQNCMSPYNEIPEEIKNKIHEKVRDHCLEASIIYHETELCNLQIQWIDFPRNKNSQKDTLVGLMCRKLPHVSDPSAAVELLLSLFRDVEAVYNQGKIISLLDRTKRIEGNEIKKAINVIETEQKTFKLWRAHSAELSRKFQVPVGIQSSHESRIKDTFELLKDMSNNEHQIIKNFIKQNNYSMSYSGYDDMFHAYVTSIKDKSSINLKDIDIFFAALCAFVEYYGETLK